MGKDFITPKELQHMLQLGKTKVYDLLKSGSLPGMIRIGGSIRIRRDTLEKYLQDLEGGNNG